jgi:hypothetical protein
LRIDSPLPERSFFAKIRHAGAPVSSRESREEAAANGFQKLATLPCSRALGRPGAREEREREEEPSFSLWAYSAAMPDFSQTFFSDATL